MSDTQDQPELQPLTADVEVGTTAREKLDFPVGKMVEVHISDGQYAFYKQMKTTKDGVEYEADVTKAVYTFVVDSDIKDATTKESLKNKEFSKTITLSEHERATYPQFIKAVLGEYSKRPVDAIGKPLQVLFGAWTEFNGVQYQPITYLPAADGQKGSDAKATNKETEVSIDDLFGK